MRHTEPEGVRSALKDLLLIVILALVGVALARAFILRGGRSGGGSSRHTQGSGSDGGRGISRSKGRAADRGPGGGIYGHGPRGSSTPPPPGEETGAAGALEFRKSLGIAADDEMKIRLYSPEDYEEQLGGAGLGSGGFVAAARTYRWIEDGWHEMPLDSAAQALELGPADYETDTNRGALLLRRLPPGLPASARRTLQ